MPQQKKYQGTDAKAIWKKDKDSEPCDVLISFGHTSLIIRDEKNHVLDHWALNALIRLDTKTALPALYTLDPTGIETLKIADPEMINTIEHFRNALRADAPHPKRLRYFLGLFVSLFIVGSLLFLAPEFMTKEAARILPPYKQMDIGETFLQKSGQICRTQDGLDAIAALKTRLFQDSFLDVVVLDRTDFETAHLPGGLILLGRGFVETSPSPDTLAGYLLAEESQMLTKNPLKKLFDLLPKHQVFYFLITGTIPNMENIDPVESFILATSPPVSQDILARRFANAQIPTTPFAYATDPSGETTLSLIEADSLSKNTSFPEILSKKDWAALQKICQK